MKRLMFFIVALLLSVNASAHKPSDSYLTLQVNGGTVEGQWDIALRDLNFAIGLDADANGEITWGEVRAKQTEISAYAFSRLSITSAGQACPIAATQYLIDDHTDGAYAVLRFRATCPQIGQTLSLRYRLFFDLDPQHKGLLRLIYEGQSRTAIFSPEQATQVFELKTASKLSQFFDYAREGVWHIWKGYDHILFLLALLLPAVVKRRGHAWQAVDAFKPAFWEVLKIVTAFTVAHSITLSMATLGVISLPSRWVESTIALSVIVAALNNVYPLFRDRRWMMAFAFGLIHGFGFASVLSDLGLPQSILALALVGFNLGVEAGQLVIVAGFLPLAYLLRNGTFYRWGVLLVGSLLIALIAGMWLVERAFNLKFLPF